MIPTKTHNPLSMDTTLPVWWMGFVISSTRVAVFEYPGNSGGVPNSHPDFLGDLSPLAVSPSTWLASPLTPFPWPHQRCCGIHFQKVKVYEEHTWILEKLVQETIHRLVKAVEPRRDILHVVMLVESIDHMPHIVEPIKEGWRLNIGVVYSCANIMKPPPRHVLRQTEGRALEHVDRLLWPPHFVVLYPLKYYHKEVTTQPEIEILEGHMWPFNIFFLHRDDNLPNKILRESQPENIKLRQILQLNSNCGFSTPHLHHWCSGPPSLEKWWGSPTPPAPPVSYFRFRQREGSPEGSPHSQPQRISVGAHQYLLGILLGQYCCLCYNLILLLHGCCRVQERKDERVRLQPIRLWTFSQGLGLPESCLHIRGT